MEDVDMLAFYVAILDTEEQKDKFTEIYTTYYGMMYQVARAITHDDKLAEDALHETCLELIEKIDFNPQDIIFDPNVSARTTPNSSPITCAWSHGIAPSTSCASGIAEVRYLMTRWMWNQHPYMKMLRMSY